MTRSNLWDEKDGIFEVSPGADITSTITEAIRLAANETRHICFEFNGVLVTVALSSDPDLIYRDWQRAMSGKIDKRIGPYPAPTLSSDQQASDARIDAANEARRRADTAAYEAKAAAKKAATDARLALAPPMAFTDEQGWLKSKAVNSDGYGGGVMTFAEQWARLMQLDISNGSALADIADTTSREADTEGTTGFMYGCAVSILAKVWTHGDELRRWHNLKTQIGHEGEKANETGGTLNPALLSIGKP